MATQMKLPEVQAYEDYLDGVAIDECPYPADTDSAAIWTARMQEMLHREHREVVRQQAAEEEE